MRFTVDHQFTDDYGVTFYGLTDTLRGTRYEATASDGRLLGLNRCSAARGWTQRFDVKKYDPRFLTAASDLNLSS